MVISDFHSVIVKGCVAGQTFAVDVYCFLHKGAYGVQNKSTDGYIKYVMKYVNLLIYHNITPILVFDGWNLSSKVRILCLTISLNFYHLPSTQTNWKHSSGWSADTKSSSLSAGFYHLILTKKILNLD